MPVRVRIPLPGPFVYVPRHRAHRKGGRTSTDLGAVVLALLVFVVALIVFLVSWFSGSVPANGAPLADPGVSIYTYMHAHGATMPPSWARVVDADRGNICHAYATGYYDRLPVGEVDEFGVTPALAKAALAGSGFCS